RTTHEASYQLELRGFTGKEADEEVGLVYFGERYLIPRIGRWASADPLAVHAVGGGEALNSYHYVGGNLLQGRDPDGLSPPNIEAMLATEWNAVRDRALDMAVEWAGKGLRVLANVAASTAPVVGEAMDAAVIADPQSSRVERALATT